MKILVAFNFPDVKPNTKEADNIVEDLEADLSEFANQFQTPYVWEWVDGGTIP